MFPGHSKWKLIGLISNSSIGFCSNSSQAVANKLSWLRARLERLRRGLLLEQQLAATRRRLVQWQREEAALVKLTKLRAELHHVSIHGDEKTASKDQASRSHRRLERLRRHIAAAESKIAELRRALKELKTVAHQARIEHQHQQAALQQQQKPSLTTITLQHVTVPQQKQPSKPSVSSITLQRVDIPQQQHSSSSSSSHAEQSTEHHSSASHHDVHDGVDQQATHAEHHTEHRAETHAESHSKTHAETHAQTGAHVQSSTTISNAHHESAVHHQEHASSSLHGS